MAASPRLTLLALFCGSLSLVAAQIGSFNYAGAYPQGCRPGMESYSSSAGAPSYSLLMGQTAYLCISLNGKVTSLFNVVVDQYTAISLTGSTGAMRQGLGWQSAAEPHNNEATDYYTAFDVTSYGVTTSIPRVYKKISMTPDYTETGIGTGNYKKHYQGTVTSRITTFPLYTVIITMEKGVVTNVGYDDGCFFCPANGPQCMANAYNATEGGHTAVGGQYIGCSTEMATCYPTLGSSTKLTAMYQNTTMISPFSTRYENTLNTTCLEFDRTTTPPNCTSRLNETITTAFNVPAVNRTDWVYNASSTARLINSTVTAAELADSAAACDLKVFVVWTGTDAGGNYLKSANKRFSRFRQFSVSTAYQSALNLGQNAIDLGKTTISIAETIPGAVARSD